jgi:hypothetical protein
MAGLIDLFQHTHGGLVQVAFAGSDAQQDFQEDATFLAQGRTQPANIIPVRVEDQGRGVIDSHLPGLLMVQVVFPQHDLVRQLPEKAQGLPGGIVENIVFACLGEQEYGNFMFKTAENTGQFDLGLPHLRFVDIVCLIHGKGLLVSL